MERIEYRRYAGDGVDDAERMAEFLSGQAWPFHGAERVERADVLRRAADGYYDNPGARTFWIVDGGATVGMVRLFDLDELDGGGAPLFDLRVHADHRGRGIGVRAVRWLTGYLFGEFGAAHRIEGTTRQDNHAMRRVFRRCGYAKEAHYRKSWPGPAGTWYDTVGYAVLRGDWESGTVTVPDFHDEPVENPRTGGVGVAPTMRG